MMKKIITLCLLSLLTITTTRAQYSMFYNENNYIGIRLGVNTSTLSFSGMDVDKSSFTGINAGIVYGISLSGTMPIFLEPGFLITSKGVKINKTREYQEIKSNLTYLEWPLVLKYKIEAGHPDFTIQPAIGGFFSMGVAGQSKYYEDRIKRSSFNSDAFRYFDAGLRFGCGFGYQNLYFDITYDLGMANIARENFNKFNYDSFDNSVHTQCFSFTLGVDF